MCLQGLHPLHRTTDGGTEEALLAYSNTHREGEGVSEKEAWGRGQTGEELEYIANTH